jgi:hypothetical protein
MTEQRRLRVLHGKIENEGCTNSKMEKKSE